MIPFDNLKKTETTKSSNINMTLGNKFVMQVIICEGLIGTDPGDIQHEFCRCVH